MKTSAGILAFRRNPQFEVFLVHPGGPFWAKKDEQAWTIPKGEYTEENPLDAACREFREETGVVIESDFIPLGEVRQSGKTVQAWAAEADFDASTIRSNTFEMEWPPRSGKTREFPEIDRGEWFRPEVARVKLLAAQVPFLDRLQALLTEENTAG